MANELSEHRSGSMDESLLSCIVCKQIAEEPLLLQCLHSCCSLCADHAATAGGSNTMSCPVCDIASDVGSKKHHNGFIADQVRCFKALRDADKCSVCREEGNACELADVWCKQCRGSLCSTCMPGHNRYNRGHETIAIDQIRSWKDVLKVPAQQCSLHRKQAELLCFDCKQAKCIDCVRQCESLGHSALQRLKGQKSETFLKDIRESVQHLLEAVVGKSGLLLHPKNLVGEIQSARAIHLDELRIKKKYAMDALSRKFEDAERVLKDCYDQLESTAASLQSLAEQLDQSVQHASKYISTLSDWADDASLLDQQPTLLSRLQALAKQLDGFRRIPEAHELVTVSGPLPEDLDEVVASWMGTPKLTTDNLGHVLAEVISRKDDAGNNDSMAQEQQLLFGSSSSSFLLLVECCDVSVTSDGRLLLAAWQHGLLEYEASGRKLSSWRPQRLSDRKDDRVTTVKAVDCGRAAVGVLLSRLVVLLQRSDAGDAWHEDRRVAVLQSPPFNLSVHGDLMAVAEWTHNGQEVAPGPQLQLLRLSDGQLLYRQSREYSICSVALTAAAVVTTSYDRVQLDDVRRLYVVDGYSHRGDRLWRHELSYKDRVLGVCAAPTGRLLYLAVQGRGDRSSSDYVRVISGEDGKKVKDVVSSSSHGLKLPGWLSLSRGQRTVLAVLGYDEASKENRTVTVYAAVRS